MSISRIQQSNQNTLQNNSTAGYSNNSVKFQLIKAKMESYWSQSDLSSSLTDSEKDSIIRHIIRFYDEKGNLINPNAIKKVNLPGKTPAEIRRIIGIEENTKQKPLEIIKDEYIQGNRINHQHQHISSKEDIQKETCSSNRFGAEYFTAISNIVKKNYPKWKQRFIIEPKKDNGFKVFGLYGIIIIILVLFLIII